MKKNMLAVMLLLCLLAAACTPEPVPTIRPTRPPASPIPPTPTQENTALPTRPAPTTTPPAPTASPLPPGVLLIIPVDDPASVKTVVSPDGRWVGVIKGETVEVWSVETRSLLGQVQQDGGVTDTIFAPDGTSFATYYLYSKPEDWGGPGRMSSVYVWKITSSGIDPEPVLLHNRSWFTSIVRYSPDSQKMLVGSSYGEVYIWDIHSGEALSTLKLHDDTIESVDMAPNGDLYASEAIPGDVKTLVSKLSDPGWRLTLQQNHPGDGRVFFSPDGSRLAMWSENGTTLLNTTTWGIDTFLLYVFAEGFTPDGSGLLVYDEGETRVVLIEDHSTLATYPISPAIFLPDGRVVGMVIEGNNWVLMQFEP